MGAVSACACSTETPLPVAVRDVLFPISDDKPGERRNTCAITLTSSSERELAHSVIKWDTTVYRHNSISADTISLPLVVVAAPLDSPMTRSILSLRDSICADRSPVQVSLNADGSYEWCDEASPFPRYQILLTP